MLKAVCCPMWGNPIRCTIMDALQTEGSDLMEPASEQSVEQRQEAFRSLNQLFSMIGSANDAEDHGYKDDAVRTRDNACDAIRVLLSEHPFISKELPTLSTEVGSQRFLDFGWASFASRVEKEMEQVNKLGDK